MNTDKKNQHYIPKFYLRNFSYHGNNNQIGIFNLKNDFFYNSAKLKSQGSKNFFYGYDGKIEDRLSEIEGVLSKTIKTIIETEELPPLDSDEYIDLLTFIILTHLRNPIAINGFKNMTQGFKKRLHDMFPNTKTKKLVPEYTHDEIIELSLSDLLKLIPLISDLSYKLLQNNTNTPFITSDFPILKYNQFLELRKWKKVKTGYGTIGLQIFIPLNSKTMLLFYDSDIYKVGFNKRSKLEICNPKDIDSLNILQFINCFETVFFDEKAQEHYVRKLFNASKSYKRAHQTTSEVGTILKDNHDLQAIRKGEKNLVIVGRTDCETGLVIQGIKMHSKGKGTKLSSALVQIRPMPRKILEDRNNR
jgi:hypothetical protein